MYPCVNCWKAKTEGRATKNQSIANCPTNLGNVYIYIYITIYAYLRKKNVKQNWQNKIKLKRFFWSQKHTEKTPAFSESVLLMVQKSQTTTWDLKFPVNNGVNCLYELVIAGFLNHQQYDWKTRGNKSCPKYVGHWTHTCDVMDAKPAPVWAIFLTSTRSGEGQIVPGSPMSWFQSRSRILHV